MRPDICALGLALLLGCSGSEGVRGQGPGYLEVTFLDVGQADAILIRTQEGQTALVDAGLSAPLDALAARGVLALDVLVASHPHADHIGGMAGIIEALPVRFYMDNGQPHTTATYRNLLRSIEECPAITYLAAEPRLLRLGSAEIQVLPLPPPGGTNLNNRSVPLIVRYGAFTLMLTGDSEVPELSYLLEHSLVPNVTVLKAPHHGSDTGFTEDFLMAARPEIVVVSVGANSLGHPGEAAMRAYAEIADTVYRTDVHGDVTIRGYADGHYEVQVSRGPLLRFGP